MNPESNLFAHIWWLALLIGGVLGTAAFRLKAVTPGGAVVGAIVAVVMMFAGGLPLLGLLALFVATGGVLSQLPNRNNTQAADQHGARTAWQVAATTGAAGVCALLLSLPIVTDPMILRGLLAGLVASLTTAFSDTISAELGSRYGGTPRWLLFGKRLEAGMSGGVTLFGLAIGGVAAVLFAWCAVQWKILPPGSERLLSLLGFGGNLLDSLLGATVQATYRCPKCRLISERRRHCDTIGERIHGLPLSNAGVNLVCTVVVVILLQCHLKF